MLTENLNFTYKRPLAIFFIAVCLIITISLVAGIVITSILVVLVRGIWNIHPHPIFIGILIVIGLLVLFFWNATKNWFSEFAIDENQVILRKITGTAITLKREDIQGLEWKGRTITFIGSNDKLILNTRALPKKLGVLLFSLLTLWVPKTALPSDVQLAVQKFNEEPTEIHPIESPLIISASTRYVFTNTSMNSTSINIFASMMLFILALVSLTWLLTNDFNIFSLLAFLATSSVLFFVLWGLLSRTIEVNNEGIKYTEGPRKRYLVWGEITVVAIESEISQITIWTKDDKYTRIHLAGQSPDNIALFDDVFFEQLHTRKIAFSYF
jgi:hypothetical protein